MDFSVISVDNQILRNWILLLHGTLWQAQNSPSLGPSAQRKTIWYEYLKKKRKSSKLPAIAIVFAPRPHVCRCRLLYFMFSMFYLPGLVFLMRKWFHKLFAGVVYSETLVTVGPRGWLKAERRRCDAHPFPLYYFSCRTFRHLKLSVCYVFIPAKGVVGVVGG